MHNSSTALGELGTRDHRFRGRMRRSLPEDAGCLEDRRKAIHAYGPFAMPLYCVWYRDMLRFHKASIENRPGPKNRGFIYFARCDEPVHSVGIWPVGIRCGEAYRRPDDVRNCDLQIRATTPPRYSKDFFVSAVLIERERTWLACHHLHGGILAPAPGRVRPQRTLGARSGAP